MIPTRICALALVVGLVPALAACDRKEEVHDEPAAEPMRVTTVDLGRSIDADGGIDINETTHQFRPNDTIYASVTTEGSATGATLVARWTFLDGQIVDETSRTISPTGPAVTAFHISKPDGLPVGSYRVEVRLNGPVADSTSSWWRRHRDFEVK